MNRAATQIVTVVLLIVPFLFVGSVGLAFVASPLTERPDSVSEWLAVGPVSQVPEDGDPVVFGIAAPRHDAWVRLRDRVVGYVYARRDPATHEIKVLAPFHGRLGAAVEYDSSAKRFQSRCYRETWFDLDGAPIGNAGTGSSPESGIPTLPSTVIDRVVFVRASSVFDQR